MIVFHIKFWRKIKKTIIEWLQPGASRFYSYNGKLLVVSPGRNYYCNDCLKPAFLVEENDCYHCQIHGRLENFCADKKCNFCVNKKG